VRPLRVWDLGRQPYLPVLALQRALCRARQAGEVDDLLLLVEHDPVITLGRGTRETSLPVAPAELRARGHEVVEVERGGDVTWHGPGQLVGYPIVHLEPIRPDLHWYLRTIEAALIAALGTLGLRGRRRDGLTGVWIGDRKVASIGIHVKQWVTFHGFALNVAPDLAAFDAFVPCGIHGVEMTSVARELGGDRPGLRALVRDALVAALARALGRVPAPGAPAGWPERLEELRTAR